jgi:hypothetical protein
VPSEFKELESLTLFYEVEDLTILQNFMVAFNRLAMGITEEKLVQACRTEKAIVKKVLKNFKDIANKNKGTQMKRLCEELEMRIDGLDTFEKFQRKILVLHKRYWESVTMAMSLGYVSVFNRPLGHKHKELNHEINRAKMEHDCTAGTDEFVPKRARFDHGGPAMSQSMGGKPPASQFAGSIPGNSPGGIACVLPGEPTSSLQRPWDSLATNDRGVSNRILAASPPSQSRQNIKKDYLLLGKKRHYVSFLFLNTMNFYNILVVSRSLCLVTDSSGLAFMAVWLNRQCPQCCCLSRLVRDVSHLTNNSQHFC